MSIRGYTRVLVAIGLAVGAASPAIFAFDRPETTFQVFQFPKDRMPRVDGEVTDWAMVPESYVVSSKEFVDDTGAYTKPEPATLDFKVKVGWVKGLNRLYFLYEAVDDCWDFAEPGLRNDTFEIVVDGDASGGPLLDLSHKEFKSPRHVGEASAVPDSRLDPNEAHWAIHGVHAQNYHVFTPAVGKDWCLSWNAASWTKEFPWSNAVCRFDGKPGEGGKLVLEFWVTLFDYAGPEGPQRAVESVLREGKLIGLSLIVIDYDGPLKKRRGFWNLSRHHTSYGNASEACAFRLMPVEPALLPELAARWSFQVIDHDRRSVAFRDESIGKAVAWKWNFGDGGTSTAQHPIHTFAKPGSYLTVLEITNAAGKTSRLEKVWDVQLR